MHNDPDVNASLTGKDADALQRKRDVLGLAHPRRSIRLELVPGINHEAADSLSETELARGFENRLDRPVLLLRREDPREVLLPPLHASVELGLGHSLGWTAVKRLPDVLLDHCCHVLLERQVLRREDSERPAVKLGQVDE